MLKSYNSHKLLGREIEEIKRYILEGTLPERVQNLHLSSKYRFKKQYRGYTVKDESLYTPNGLKVVPLEEQTRLLKQLYNNPEISRKNVDIFYKRIVKRYANITKDTVKEFLNDQESYQLTKKQVASRLSRPLIANEPKERYQVDFIILKDLSRYNSGYKYILVLMDIFSKYTLLWPTKTRQASSITEGLMTMFNAMGTPSILQGDNEFNFRELLDMAERGCFTVVNSKAYNPESQGQVERQNRTIKNILNLFFDQRKNKEWISLIEGIVDNLNKAPLRALVGYTPQKVHFSKDKALISKIYKHQYRGKEQLLKNLNKDHLLPQLEIGDLVRIQIFKVLKGKGTFLKKDRIRWSMNKYTVDEVYTTMWNTFTYRISNGKVYTRSQLLLQDEDATEDEDDRDDGEDREVQEVQEDRDNLFLEDDSSIVEEVDLSTIEDSTIEDE